MEYKDYLEEKLNELSDTKIVVVEELNYEYEPKEDEILVVLKNLNGTIVNSSYFQPIQLNIFSSKDIVGTRDLFTEFVKRYSNTHTNIDFTYYKQDYSTPIDVSNFLEIGSTFKTMFIINGTLVINQNLMDVSKVILNGFEINYEKCNITYSAVVNSFKDTTNKLQSVTIPNANTSIYITLFIENNGFINYLKLLRNGQININDLINVELAYINGNTENFNARITSIAESYDITNPPRMDVVLVRCDR